MSRRFITPLLIVGLMCLTGCVRTIHQSVANKNYSQVKSMLDENPDLVNARDDHRLTPLHIAVRNRDERMVRMLIDRGADVNAAANEWTPLHQARAVGGTRIEKMLIDAGAGPKWQQEEGEKPKAE